MYKAIKNIRDSPRFIPQTLSKQPIFPLSTSIISSSPSSLSHTRQRHDDSNAQESSKDSISPPTLFVVQPRFRPETLLKTKLNEALNLANSLEEQRDGFYDTDFSKKDLPPHIVVQNPAYRTTRADTYFGPGTVDTIKCHINAVDSQDGLDAVFVNAILTGIQQRNLERAWGKPVLDRVGLIIEIFHAHAQTKEAKLQAELAALMYKKTRLVRIRGSDGRYTFGADGEAEVVSARGRGGSGGRGFISGAGETELQLQRRRILERRNQLLLEIKAVRRTRALQRASRKRHGGSHGQDMPTVAIVGYTNAGKSTLVSALSDTYLFCDDRLFATVDPKVRSVILPSGKKVLLSDTVGFISELPVQLVEAFHATLEEVVEADLLVHVLDSSAPSRDMQRESVLQVLQQIGVPGEKLRNMIEVWNKIDLMDEEPAANESDDGKENMDDDEDDIGDVMSLSGDSEETMDGNGGDCSDGRVSHEDGVEWDDDDDGDSFVGWKPLEDQPEEFSSEVGGVVKSGTISQPECSPHVRTSAVTGVGLQELLQLIDDKLKTEKVVERGVFDRKWRPPRDQDTSVVSR